MSCRTEGNELVFELTREQIVEALRIFVDQEGGITNADVDRVEAGSDDQLREFAKVPIVVAVLAERYFPTEWEAFRASADESRHIPRAKSEASEEREG
jgi:hypothetical protein